MIAIGPGLVDLCAHRSLPNPFARRNGIPRKESFKSTERITILSEKLDIPYLDTLLGPLFSEAEKQRVSLAVALLHSPRLLVLEDTFCQSDEKHMQRSVLPPSHTASDDFRRWTSIYSTRILFKMLYHISSMWDCLVTLVREQELTILLFAKYTGLASFCPAEVETGIVEKKLDMNTSDPESNMKVGQIPSSGYRSPTRSR